MNIGTIDSSIMIRRYAEYKQQHAARFAPAAPLRVVQQLRASATLNASCAF
jgi:hypothetical protein